MADYEKDTDRQKLRLDLLRLATLSQKQSAVISRLLLFASDFVRCEDTEVRATDRKHITDMLRKVGY